jgi:SAM-dependent methyltransferase
MSPLEKILSREPVFCFGSDLDWCNDTALELLLDAFAPTGAKVTIFATHRTRVLAQPRAQVEIAVHPNFLPGSTHGDTVEQVIEHVFELYPEAKSYRAHSYYDSQRMTEQMAARGIRYDANLCLYRQGGLAPLRHCHIDWRFPSWLDDNIHWRHAGSWRLADLQRELQTPGLKLINIHPPCVALNVPDRASLETNRAEMRNGDLGFFRDRRHRGHGAGTFLAELLDWLRHRHPTYHLSELNALHAAAPPPAVDPRLAAAAQPREIEGRPPITDDYDAADDRQRMEMVRGQYDRFGERGRYATSRDYNNRELEIDAIRRNVTGSRVLDLGCGNGYTLLVLGSVMDQGRLVGVDFSRNMITGALELAEQEFRGQIQLRPEYVCADAFAYLEGVAPGTFDTVISERLVVNLPSWERQRSLIESIIAQLPPGGRYLMMEGSAQGFRELNEVRRRCGLAEIPDRYPGNESSNKLDEAELDALLERRSDVSVRHEHLFGFYAVASKVLHALLVAPDEPKFASPVNDCARLVQSALTDAGIYLPRFGATKLWVIEKISRAPRR